MLPSLKVPHQLPAAAKVLARDIPASAIATGAIVRMIASSAGEGSLWAALHYNARRAVTRRQSAHLAAGSWGRIIVPNFNRAPTKRQPMQLFW